MTPPKIWIHAQFGLPFHKFLTASHIFTDIVRSRFTAWCTKYGVQLNIWAVPYLQLGPVPYKTFTFLSYGLKYMSIARR